MDRREALKTSSLLLGYTITAGTAAAVLNGCSADPSIDWNPTNLNARQAVLLAELVETIIPATETPGAKDALVDRFIDAVLDCYPAEEKDKFLQQLDAFDKDMQENHGKSFVKADDETRKMAMNALVAASEKDPASNMFRQLKEWTVTGYCTSEVGATEHLNWNPVPGAPYQGCIDFSEVGKTWAL